MSKWKWILILGLAWSPWALGAFVSWTTASWEISPPNTESLNLTDDRIRELKENVRNRLQVEHHFGTGVSASDNGRHREGSANAWYETPCPSANVTGDPGTGAVNYTTPDQGKMCRDSATAELRIWDGTQYVPAVGALRDTINLFGTPLFTKAGLDAFDIHNHDARHRISGTNGAWVVGADPMPFQITDIQADTSLDLVNCGTVNDTILASQVFGSAGTACLSITRNFTGRATTTNGFLYGHLTFVATGSACEINMTIFVDSLAAGINGGFSALQFISSSGNFGSVDVFGYVTGLSVAAHEFAMHASDSTDNGCTLTTGGGNMIWIDLGT